MNKHPQNNKCLSRQEVHDMLDGFRDETIKQLDDHFQGRVTPDVIEILQDIKKDIKPWDEEIDDMVRLGTILKCPDHEDHFGYWSNE